MEELKLVVGVINHLITGIKITKYFHFHILSPICLLLAFLAKYNNIISKFLKILHSFLYLDYLSRYNFAYFHDFIQSKSVISLTYTKLYIFILILLVNMVIRCIT